ncbi:hypothetical protein NQZ68_035144 [Dissostichus eleginoides]|nr:hypothetical protein NQZ68_035144 [Dissostichus eleginoides]
MARWVKRRRNYFVSSSKPLGKETENVTHDRLAQRGGVGHAGRMHMANPLGYTSGMDLHSLREGGVSYTNCP